jgi:hypothetical protein
MMKIVTFASALLLSIPFSAAAAEKDLHGTWKMMSQSQKVLDTGEVRSGRGSAPRGYVTFSPDGRLMSVIVNEKRPKPESVAKMTDQQRIELFNTMNAYTGTYKLEGNKLTYQFELTHNEIPARASAREIRIEGRKLTMVNEPSFATSDGKRVQTTTVWEKMQPAKK